MFKLLITIIISLVITNFIVSAQEKGVEPKPFNPDSVIIFQTPRPLMEALKSESNLSFAYGADVLISDSGFGVGLFFHNFLTRSTLLTSSLYISGARNSDEFEEFNWASGSWQVRNKVNRLFKFPLMFGLQQFVFEKALDDNLKPFITIGGGPTFILENPYTYDRVPNGEIMGWFESFNYGRWHTRFGAYVGIGAYFGRITNSLLGVNIKYYYVPFGGNGLESVAGLPINNFGGIFLSLTIGAAK